MCSNGTDGLQSQRKKLVALTRLGAAGFFEADVATSVCASSLATIQRRTCARATDWHHQLELRASSCYDLSFDTSCD
eukprot:3305754-Amphidinium_carterae.1